MHLLLISLSKECSWAFSFFPETWDGPTHLKHSRQWVAVTALQNLYIILYQLKHCPKIRWVPSSFPPSVSKNWTRHSSVPSPAGCPQPQHSESAAQFTAVEVCREVCTAFPVKEGNWKYWQLCSKIIEGTQEEPGSRCCC